MENIWWALFAFSGVVAVAAVWFMVLWLQARTKLAIAVSKLAEFRSRDEMMEDLREHTVIAAKAAAVETGNQLSSKLLDDHKRENEVARELHGKVTRTITETLTKQVEVMGEKLASLHDQHGKQAGKMETIWQSLTNPTGAGKIAEIGLENLLKSFGLEAGRDFETQFTLMGGGGKLRPDAVVYLPQNRVVVIDCKSSSFAIDNTADDALKTTMNQHLRDLINKDYRAAVIQDYKKKHGVEPMEVWSVMYVPTESLVERLKQADAGFMQRLLNAEIMLASSATLHGLLSLARIQIENEKQIRNSERIVEAAESLLDGIIAAFSHVEALSNALKSSLNHFNKFAASANSSVLARAEKFAAFGVTPSRGKSLPATISRYDLISRESAEVLEVDFVATREVKD